MKLLHLSDLHLGKRLHEMSLLEDQAYILEEILQIAEAERPDAVVVAGDVYDKAVPPAEAVELLDGFLSRMAQGRPVFVLSGNHDSPERLAFGGRLMAGSGVYLSPVFRGGETPVTLEDPWGPVDIHLLPFLKPVQARRAFPEAEIESYTDAVRAAVAHMPADWGRRNVLVTHQFVTGAVPSESEDLTVGGADNVDAAVFDGFDYVALGHIHRAQNVGSPRIRYCGTPLKYAFSEAGSEKSVTVAELGPKGQLAVRSVPLRPRRDLREIRGTYLEVTARDFYRDTAVEDYLRVTLTDEEDVPDAAQKLRSIYPNLLRLDYDNRRTRAAGVLDDAGDAERRSPLELLDDFFTQANGRPMGAQQRQLAETLIAEIWGDTP